MHGANRRRDVRCLQHQAQPSLSSILIDVDEWRSNLQSDWLNFGGSQLALTDTELQLKFERPASWLYPDVSTVDGLVGWAIKKWLVEMNDSAGVDWLKSSFIQLNGLFKQQSPSLDRKTFISLLNKIGLGLFLYFLLNSISTFCRIWSTMYVCIQCTWIYLQ